MSLMNGVVIGIVTDVNDNGKVKIKFPWLPEEPESDWIRIATAMAGNDRGTFFMPEKDDEVLVAFEHGNTEYPFVVGFLWNGKDKPPEKDKNIRRIKTKSGHTIEFNDNKGQEKIVIESQGGQTVELNDSPPAGRISITTKSKNTIEINDLAPGTIKMSTQTGMITISAPVGTVNVDCLTATIAAKSSVNLTAPTVNCTGILNVPNIIAGSGQFGAVVSGAYNPLVPGNIFGL